MKQTLGARLRAQGFDLTKYNGVNAGTYSVRCSQCETLVICGVATHETGCPNARRSLDEEEE